MTQYESSARYEIELLTADGVRIEYLTDVGSFQYTKGVSSDGDFSITLGPLFDFSVIKRHQQVRFHRQPPGGVMAIDFVGIITGWDVSQNVGGYVRTINGPGLGWLMGGRVVAYYAGHSSASMSDQAGDMILEIVRDNLGADALTANGRTAAGNISSASISVIDTGGYGPSLEKGFSFNNVADTIREVQDAARTAGTPVYWDVSLSAGVALVTVRVGQPGNDLTSGARAVTFSPEFGNFEDGRYTYDARDEVNRAYVLGRGTGQDRNIQTSEDTERSNYSVWALREAALEDTQQSTSAALVDRADALVLAGRPLQSLTGNLRSTERTQYGRDWALGDKVNVVFDGAKYIAIVRAVTAKVSATGYEDIIGAFELTE